MRRWVELLALMTAGTFILVVLAATMVLFVFRSLGG